MVLHLNNREIKKLGSGIHIELTQFLSVKNPDKESEIIQQICIVDQIGVFVLESN